MIIDQVELMNQRTNKEKFISKDKSPFLIEKVKIDENRMKISLNSIGYYLSDVKSKIIENSNDTVNLIFK